MSIRWIGSNRAQAIFFSVFIVVVISFCLIYSPDVKNTGSDQYPKFSEFIGELAEGYEVRVYETEYRDYLDRVIFLTSVGPDENPDYIGQGYHSLVTEWSWRYLTRCRGDNEERVCRVMVRCNDRGEWCLSNSSFADGHDPLTEEEIEQVIRLFDRAVEAIVPQSKNDDDDGHS